MRELPVYERRPWHYGPPAFGLVVLGISITMLVMGAILSGIMLLFVTGAFAFQTWWVWVDIPNHWPYKELKNDER